MRIRQINLGWSRRLQDLLYQTVALAVVVEPYRVLDASDWDGDTNEMVAVIWTSMPGAFFHRAPLERGNGVGERIRVTQQRMGSVRGVPGRGW
jgi:hypothetical protein